MQLKSISIKLKGGKGSGFFSEDGYEGIPGKIGGSRRDPLADMQRSLGMSGSKPAPKKKPVKEKPKSAPRKVEEKKPERIEEKPQDKVEKPFTLQFGKPVTASYFDYGDGAFMLENSTPYERKKFIELAIETGMTENELSGIDGVSFSAPPGYSWKLNEEDDSIVTGAFVPIMDRIHLNPDVLDPQTFVHEIGHKIYSQTRHERRSVFTTLYDKIRKSKDLLKFGLRQHSIDLESELFSDLFAMYKGYLGASLAWSGKKYSVVGGQDKISSKRFKEISDALKEIAGEDIFEYFAKEKWSRRG